MPLRNAGLPTSARRMRGGSRAWLGAVVLVALAASGCSRLSFVRPDLDRQDEYERVSHEVRVRDEPGARAAADAHLRVRVAAQHLAQGELDSAGEEARHALELDKRSSSAHTVLATIHERRGDPRQAGEHYRRAAELAPANGDALNNYGSWLCGDGQPVESLEWFGRALADRSYRTPEVALANAGACADQAGQGERADELLRAALDIDPQNPLALSTRAERALRAGDAFSARAFSERRLSAAPATPDALLLASQIEEELGDMDAAAKYVQRMRAEFPNTSGSEAGDGGRQ